jgi:hypothetical protein
MAKRLKIPNGQSEVVNHRSKRLAIVMSVLLFTTSEYPFGIFKRLAIVLSVLLFTTMAKRLKIPNGQSEVVNRRTDSTMAKRLKIPNEYSEVVNRRRTDSTMAAVCSSSIYSFLVAIWYLQTFLTTVYCNLTCI